MTTNPLSPATPIKRIRPFLPAAMLLSFLAGFNLIVDIVLRLRFVPAWSSTWYHLHLFEDSLYRASAREPAWYVALLLVNILVFALLVHRGERLNLRTLLLLGVGIRAASLATRIILGESIDQDLEHLYFQYGQSFARGEYPLMEYPQLALIFFTLLYHLAVGDQGLFLILFPILLIPAEMTIIFCIYRIGEEFHNASAGSVAAAFYAISPFTLIFWFEKYDALPTAFLLLGVYLFIKNKVVASATALAGGLASKWLPGLAIPVLLLSLLKQHRFRNGATFSIAILLVSLGLFLPFWFFDPDRFLHTYQFHGQRGLIGQSFFFIPSYFLTSPGPDTSRIVPWVDQPSAFSNEFMLLVQAGVILTSWLVYTARPSDPRRDVVHAILPVVAFILLNRIYSPQFVLFVLAGYLTAFSALARSKKALFLGLATCSMFTLANFMVWPMYVSFWFQANIVFFGLTSSLWLALLVASTFAPPAGTSFHALPAQREHRSWPLR